MFWQLGIFLNTVKRILEVLHPGVEDFLKCWAACLTIEDGNTIFGEQMNGITVTLRKKYKKYMQAIVEKLVSNVSVTLNIPSFHLPLYSLGVTFCRHKQTEPRGSKGFSKRRKKQKVNPRFVTGCRPCVCS